MGLFRLQIDFFRTKELTKLRQIAHTIHIVVCNQPATGATLCIHDCMKRNQKDFNSRPVWSHSGQPRVKPDLITASSVKDNRQKTTWYSSRHLELQRDSPPGIVPYALNIKNGCGD